MALYGSYPPNMAYGFPPNAMNMAYGSFGLEGGPDLGPSGVEKPKTGRYMVFPTRTSLNGLPVGLAVGGPVLLFAVVCGFQSFGIRYTNPLLVKFVIAAGVLAVVGCILWSLKEKFNISLTGIRGMRPTNPFTWIHLISVLMLGALVAACVLGDETYHTYTAPYSGIQGLGTYNDVYPNTMRGQQLMDAGIVNFANSSYLDLSKSMGFKNGKTYCVAPISIGGPNTTSPTNMSTYDFWAVGTDCCSAIMNNFHCDGFNQPTAKGGLRLMNDQHRAFYRLAVQEAEATYGITAAHPLFFTWMINPGEVINSWPRQAVTQYVKNVLAFFLFDAFVVICAAIAFSKLGRIH